MGRLAEVWISWIEAPRVLSAEDTAWGRAGARPKEAQDMAAVADPTGLRVLTGCASKARCSVPWFTVVSS